MIIELHIPIKKVRIFHFSELDKQKGIELAEKIYRTMEELKMYLDFQRIKEESKHR